MCYFHQQIVLVLILFDYFFFFNESCLYFIGYLDLKTSQFFCIISVVKHFLSFFCLLKFTFLYELKFYFSLVNYVDVFILFLVNCLVNNAFGINGSTCRGKKFFFFRNTVYCFEYFGDDGKRFL